MPYQRSPERSSPSRATSDPYLTKKIYRDPNICPTCGLVYHKKRWHRDDKLKEALSETARHHKCPACRKIEDHYPLGIVTISGEFWPTIKNEILNLVHNQEEKEMFANPLARIMSLKYQKDMMVIETTTENLAMRIGKTLYRTYKGDLKISISDNKIAQVSWYKTADLSNNKSLKQ
jgi:hypothetical protein